MSTAANVTAAKPKVGGGVYVGPVGSTAPSDATSALDAAFKSLGYCSEDGLTNSNSIEVTDVKAWGGDIVNSLLSQKTDTFQFKLIENLNADVLKTVYGSKNVIVGSSGEIEIVSKAEDTERFAWVFEIVLNKDTVKRIYVPEAKITEIGDIVYKDDEPIGYEITISAYPDASAATHYEWIE